MQLSKESLNIDAAKVAGEISYFIEEKLVEFNRKGIVVPISGGLDSSVVAGLCVNAVGNKKVIGLMLPEKQGNPEAEKYSNELAASLKIKTKKIDISKALDVFGTYDFALSKIPTRSLKQIAVKSFLNLSKTNPFLKGIRGQGSRVVHEGMANFYVKNRVRFVFCCKFAEVNNLLLAGSAHKSEDLVGLFAKFGVDDLADIMPLKNLYRTQILQIGKYLNIPESIIKRTPNPDIIPGVKDKYKDILGIDSENLDLVLWGLENNMPAREIARQLNLNERKINEVSDLINSTAHMRNHSLSPIF